MAALVETGGNKVRRGGSISDWPGIRALMLSSVDFASRRIGSSVRVYCATPAGITLPARELISRWPSCWGSCRATARSLRPERYVLLIRLLASAVTTAAPSLSRSVDGICLLSSTKSATGPSSDAKGSRRR